MSSELRVDKIIPTDGAPSGTGILGGGGVIQVVSMDLVSTASTTSTSFVDVSNFNLAITPKFTTSRILVIMSCRCNSSSGSNVNTRSSLRISRGSTPIANHFFGHFIGNSGTNDSNNYESVCMVNFDNPGTTSATTYKVEMASDNSACTTSISGGAGDGSHRSTLTLMEVSA